MRQAEKFKNWLQKQGGSEDLRKAYCQDVAHVDWADKLPARPLRWLIMTAVSLGVGAVTNPATGAVATTALSAGDYFLLDKLLKGWKQNHFIERPLKGFLR